MSGSSRGDGTGSTCVSTVKRAGGSVPVAVTPMGGSPKNATVQRFIPGCATVSLRVPILCVGDVNVLCYALSHTHLL